MSAQTFGNEFIFCEGYGLNRFRTLIEKHYDVVSYLVFGVLTTLVNYIVYFPLYNVLHWSAAFSNAVAWAVAVAFAYLTNKPFVFKSKDWSASVVVPELIKFVGCRVGSGVIETGIMWILVDLLSWNGNLFKILTSVVVVVLNYIASKWFVFRNKSQS